MNYKQEFENYAVKHRGLSSNTLNAYNKYVVTNLTPNIIEERPMNVAVMDVQPINDGPDHFYGIPDK